MPTYLDVQNWARKELFDFFRGNELPFFNVCTKVEVTALLTALRRKPEISVTLAYHYFVMRAVNEVEQFHYRLRGENVIIHEAIHGGTTVLLPNETFNFAHFDYTPSFSAFYPAAKASVEAVRSGSLPLDPRQEDDRIHCTTLPWFSFTSFAHARKLRPNDSIPKFAFGKFDREETGRVWLPISVEVHHALMDGLHVGRFLSALQDALDQPEKVIEG
ncbi:MAG: hypothetical protein K1Y36_10120 [Blastocatellia bacterium]|nr:hypothetical protein [Blastocatellia bacterium]